MMILVCKEHVKEGLSFIHLPHIYHLKECELKTNDMTCHLCDKKAQYKLYNFFPQRKRKLSKVI